MGDLEAKIMKQVDETAFALRLDLAREKKLREEAEERHEKEVADEIIRIADTVDQERKQRLDGEETLLKRLNDEVFRLTDIIAQEQTTQGARDEDHEDDGREVPPAACRAGQREEA